MSRYPSIRYLLIWVLVTVGLLIQGGALNFYMDPLMFRVFDGGYQKHFMFNERISKIAYYRDQKEQIDCIVLGSSRTTFFDVSALEGLSCANYSFSGATAAEILAYLKYLKKMGFAPKTIIVGADDFSSSGTRKRGDSVPLFVRDQEPIGSAFKYYISIDTFIFSMQTLLGKTHSPNYYDSNLHKYIGFPLRQADKQYHDDFYVSSSEDVSSTLHYYAQFHDLYPNANWIGYIPPISQWARLRLGKSAVRKKYVEVLGAYSKIFDEFYDFTFMTNDCDEVSHTYDGIHYSDVIYDRVAVAINERSQRYLLGDKIFKKGGQFLSEHYNKEVMRLAPPICASERPISS